MTPFVVGSLGQLPVFPVDDSQPGSRFGPLIQRFLAAPHMTTRGFKLLMGEGHNSYLAEKSSGLLPFYGRVHFLVLSWSNNCYLGFQSAVLVAIRAA